MPIAKSLVQVMNTPLSSSIQYFWIGPTHLFAIIFRTLVVLLLNLHLRELVFLRMIA